MAKPEEPYRQVFVESYTPSSTSVLHGDVHIRPLPGQAGIPPTLQVEYSKALSRNFPVGTQFELTAKLTDREGGGEYLYSSFRWVFKETNKRNWKSEAFVNADGPHVIVASHPARAGWNTKNADPSPMFKRVMARAESQRRND